MYHYVEDKELLSRMRCICGKIMQDFCHCLKEDYAISSIFYLVGSGARNLITQNSSEPIDLDYNLEIIKCEDFWNCRGIKEAARKSFNKALRKHNWGDCQDSTSSLTTERKRITSGNNTEFSIDVCIVIADKNGCWQRLIHNKTGVTFSDTYCLNPVPHSDKISKKVKVIKNNGKWMLVREQYLNIKNKYLQRNDHNHPSFICYAEAVNNVYNTITNRR